ncbi:MAG: methylmalonyl-CoA mutase [Acidimicrobiia bacterium]|nr:methylmalonyl-CoA mutase [Acidimicrobiia bacterium]MBT8216683.1 methylmalonyl-CoA mutase [Acidimicrobiia bacterium]NNF11445.1 methylmalonyl-CoA mutase [Acidimicrobiia bacterium]NNL69631.1 methylmalonyl-CoA mutase [Acidimicrobiia bacterium]
MDNSANTTPGHKISLDTVHGPSVDPPELGAPGEFPFTRGPYPTMYRGRLWTMRQYAGFGDAAATNGRFKALLEAGQTGLSVAFDLPTQMGYDSDDPIAAGEVGKVGVAIDSLEDMRTLLDGIPLDTVTTSMTINATAAALLLLYQLVAEEQGVDPADIGGTVQNDILKEYAARGTYIYPPEPSMRLVTDLFAYCAAELPNWNTISISGYHIREAGSTAAEEIGLTLANALAYVDAARAAGLDVDDFAPRLSFFWNSHSNFLEEVAKFRAARRLWAHLMRDRVGASNPASWRMRFHTQTAGSSLTAQQPLTNVVRTALEALSAVLGGTQSLHTNSFDEALGLPTEEAATLALRTQQIIGYESGVTETVDPLAGSYVVEHLTDRLQERATEIIHLIDRNGGAVAAVETGLVQGMIEDSAYETARAIETGEQIIVGVNRFQIDEDDHVPPLALDPALEPAQIKRLAEHRANRGDVSSVLDAVRVAAAGPDNLLYPMKAALAAGATVGEVSGVLREVFGEYRP